MQRAAEKCRLSWLTGTSGTGWTRSVTCKSAAAIARTTFLVTRFEVGDAAPSLVTSYGREH